MFGRVHPSLHATMGSDTQPNTSHACPRRFELAPLEELEEGRPRVDCLCNMSGIFRDSFQNVVELLDDLFQRAAAADEPPERNYIRRAPPCC